MLYRKKTKILSCQSRELCVTLGYSTTKMTMCIFTQPKEELWVIQTGVAVASLIPHGYLGVSTPVKLFLDQGFGHCQA